MSKPLVVVGGGGMGRCLLDIVEAINASVDGGRHEVVGVLDDGSPDEGLLADRDVAFLGGLSRITDLAREVGYVIGIASPEVRRTIDDVLARTGRPSPVLVHPNVHLGHDVHLGPGTVVASHVSMENHIRVGRHVHVNQNCTIGHDSVIGDHCTVSPLVAVSGNVRMESSVFVGTGASIRQGLALGRGSIVGMGSVVVSGVAEHTTVMGVPARAR